MFSYDGGSSCEFRLFCILFLKNVVLYNYMEVSKAFVCSLMLSFSFDK